MTPAAHAAAAFWIMSCAALAFAMISCAPPPPVPPVNPANLQFLDQGPNWTQSTRSDFHSRDQGSRIMPLRWMQALKQPKGDPFMADSLLRYGYLPNSEIPGMPIGFTAAGPSGSEIVGMTCWLATRGRLPSTAPLTGSMAGRPSPISRVFWPISTPQ